MSDVFSIYPFFSSPISLSFLDAKETLNALKNIKFESAASEYIEEQSTTERTNTLYLLNLDNFLSLRNDIMQRFNEYKNNHLMLSNTEFQITTSWGVRAKKGSYSQMHSHTNAFISGVLYLNGDKDTGDIEFDSPIYEQILVSPTEFNILNSKTWTIKPQKNLLIFFPSYLRHRIKKNKSNEDRYSIAFNLIPYGTYGKSGSDSEISLVFPS